DLESRGELRAFRIEVEPRDRERRDRIEVVRIEDVEQLGRDLDEVAVEITLDARGEKRERLDQSLDVRIGRLIGLQLEPAGHLRIGARETLAHATEVGKLLEVVVEEFVGGRLHREG